MQNRCEGCKIKGCRLPQLCNDRISMKPDIGYIAYTQCHGQLERTDKLNYILKPIR
jgi:hypothetical protein